jgi:hypothetical protein
MSYSKTLDKPRQNDETDSQILEPISWRYDNQHKDIQNKDTLE